MMVAFCAWVAVALCSIGAAVALSFRRERLARYLAWAGLILLVVIACLAP